MYGLHHNVRIFLDIKRKLQNLLVTSPVINGDTVLFNLSTANIGVFDIRPELFSVLNNFFTDYRDKGAIKDFAVDVSSIYTMETNDDMLNNVLRGSVTFTLFGNDKQNTTNLQLNNLINFISDFTEDNNISIFNIS